MSNHLALATDTKLAELHNQAMRLSDRLAALGTSAQRHAGATFYYRGRRRVTDMQVAEAVDIITAELARMDAHAEAWDAASGGEYRSGMWIGWAGAVEPYNMDSARRTLAGLTEARRDLAKVTAEAEKLEEVYVEAGGWSRFFLVTSSAGHIHSSMSCSTCRPTTAYGWLPALSGETEAEAVAAHGPALCSVCFPSAPVEWVGGKITKAQAAKRAA